MVGGWGLPFLSAPSPSDLVGCVVLGSRWVYHVVMHRVILLPHQEVSVWVCLLLSCHSQSTGHCGWHKSCMCSFLGLALFQTTKPVSLGLVLFQTAKSVYLGLVLFQTVKSVSLVLVLFQTAKPVSLGLVPFQTAKSVSLDLVLFQTVKSASLGLVLFQTVKFVSLCPFSFRL